MWEEGGTPDFEYGTEGEYGDMGKSELIRSQCDPNFPKMDAGDKIKLLKLGLERINKFARVYK